MPSNGTIPHFTGSRLEQALGIKLTRVAYRGSAPIINDLVGGHMPFAISTLTDAIPQHRAGQHPDSRGRQRAAFAVPARCADLEGERRRSGGGCLVRHVAAGGRPPDFAKKLSEAAATALAKPEVKEKLLAIGLIPVGSTPEGLTQELAANTAFWQPVVKATGYKITN